MIRKCIPYLLTALLALVSLSGEAQAPSKSLPTEPAEFIKGFDGGIHKLTNNKIHTTFVKMFVEKWELGTFNDREKELFIVLTNRMLESGYPLYPEIYQFSRSFNAVKAEDAHTRIPAEDFFKISELCLSNLQRKGIMSFFRFIEGFTRAGEVFKTSNSSWCFSQAEPKIEWIAIPNPGKGEIKGFPQLTFANSDLTYVSKADSTTIVGTGGTFNVLNRWFIGNGGKIDWGKMGLVATDVYCEVSEYKINLNYPIIEIDSVIFHYNGLLNKPLMGKFIERNRGFTNVNDAAYPYFISYEGGVQIENLIPNVTYLGGFSLRGIKKVGSAYFGWVDVPERPEPIKAPKEEKPEEKEEDPYSGFDDYYDWDDESVYELDDYEKTEENPIWEDDENENPLPKEEEEGVVSNVPEGWGYEDHPGQEYKKIPAQLNLLKDGQIIMKLKADEFVLDMTKLHSRNTDVTLFIGEDSVTHPNMELLYEVETDKIFLMKDVKKTHQPFTSPFHGYFLYFDAIVWDRTSNEIELTAMIDKEHQVGAVESIDFFKRSRFKQFKGVLPFNPITAIYKYKATHPGVDIFPGDVCRDMERPDAEDAFMFTIRDLIQSGFITYDPVSKQITPLEKLDDWAKAARKTKDYDVLQILSTVKSGSHAQINVITKELHMNGVRPFPLSDSQYVWIVPADSSVTIGEDRDVTFGGAVEAGKLDFYGDNSSKFFFDYENFKIYCDSIDSLRFVLIREQDFRTPFTPLQKALRNTSIEGVTGAIYINKPNNKSGKEVYPEYSIFDSYTNSYIYWSKSSVHEGVYTKDKLYFSIDPFVLDSLETFNERALSFEGEFESSEIFPRFRHKLSVMEDQTLGLVHVTPEEGYPVYEGKGNFKNEIKLDGGGLQGNGDLEFNYTTAKSDSFVFFFDSVRAITKDFFMPGGSRNGAFFPEIKAEKVDYTWKTKTDEIEIGSIDGSPMVMFGGEGVMNGKIVITPEGVYGKGTLTLGEVTITSDRIDFNEMDLKAKDGFFQVADKNNPSKIHFMAENVNVDYNVNSHSSAFETTKNGVGDAFFPVNSYRTTLGKGTYARSSGDIDLEAFSAYASKNYFFSTDPALDSLAFNAKSSHYNVDQRQIQIEGVPHILVADAKITPDGEAVVVRESGMLQSLKNATIEANQDSKYHHIYEGEIEVLSRNDYKGTGKYDYIPIDGKDQYIQLTAITVGDDTTTIAAGTIEEEQNFHLTDKIFFKGNTRLVAARKFIEFKGFVKIESDNEFFQDTWFEFNRVVNPDTVIIPIDNPKDSQGNPLFAGVHFIDDFRIFYSTFLQPKRNPKHLDLLLAKGGLTVDRMTGEFRIGPEAKLFGKQYRGTVVSYDDELETITTKGLVDFPQKFEKNTISLKVSGEWREELKSKEVTSNLVLGLDLGAIPKEAWIKLTEKMKITTSINEEVDYQRKLLVESLSEMLDEGQKDEANTQRFVKSIEDALIYSDVKVAKDLPFSLLLSDVRLNYDAISHSLASNGDIGLIGIDGEGINKKVTAKIEYNFGRQSRSGVRYSDTLAVYLEVDEFNWVYFQFEGDVIKTWSSDLEGYNMALATAIEKRKKSEGYRFELATDEDKDKFLQRFITRYIWKE